MGIKILLLVYIPLTEEQHNDIISGTGCTPTSLFELLQSGWTDIGVTRMYGSIKLNKTL